MIHATRRLILIALFAVLAFQQYQIQVLARDLSRQSAVLDAMIRNHARLLDRLELRFPELKPL